MHCRFPSASEHTKISKTFGQHLRHRFKAGHNPYKHQKLCKIFCQCRKDTHSSHSLSLSLGLKATPFLGTATFRLTRPTPLIAHCLGDIVPAAGARTPVWNVLIRAKVSLLFKNTSSLKPPFSSCSYGVMVYDG